MTFSTGENIMATPDFGDNTYIDESAEADWRALADRLGTRLETLERGEHVEIGRTTNRGGIRTLLVFTRMGSGRVRCSVESSTFLVCFTSEDLLELRARYAALVDLGWRRLRDATYVNEVGKRSVGELVEVVVRALREVWEIADSSVLTVHDPFGSGSPHSSGPEARVKEPAPAAPSAGGVNRRSAPPASVGVVPDDSAHLLEMTHKILAAHFGGQVTLNQGVIGFTTEAELHTNVLVSPGTLRLEFCTVLAHEIPDMDLLGAVIAEHSSRWPDISIVVTKGHVFAVRALDAAVFAHTNLLVAVQSWQEFCNDGAIDIIEQLQPGFENDPERRLYERVPERLIDMVYRYAQGDRSGLTPDQIARGCRGNTPMLRRYARICAEQIDKMLGLENAWIARGGSPGEIAGTHRQRRAIEQFLPVLIASITLAAQYNDDREVGCGG
jgi:hypothetical protein